MISGQNTIGFDIKVFRLNQVSRIQNIPIKPDQRDENKIICFKNNTKIYYSSVDTTSLDNIYCWNGSYYQIATSFGKVYVGDNIQIFLSLKNVTNLDLEYVIVNVIIEYEVKKQNYSAKTFQSNDLRSGFDIYFPLNIPIEENDQYIIILEIKYKEKPIWTNNQNQTVPVEKIQQKKFRIATKMPYDLDFRAANIKDDYYVEYTIKNTSQTLLQFHKIEFRTLDFYLSKKIVISWFFTSLEGKLKESGMAQSDLMSLGPDDIRKYLFFVEIKPELKELDGGAFKKKQGVMQMGNLFLEWNACGIHVGSTITINVNPQELKMELFKAPESLVMQETAQLVYKVINNSNNKVELTLKLAENEMRGLKIFNLSKNNMIVNGLSHEIINLMVYPVAPGLQKLYGIKAFANAKEYKLNDLGDFVVKRPEAVVKINVEEINLLE